MLTNFCFTLKWSSLQVSVSYAECHYTECRQAECLYAESHYVECRYAECRAGLQNGLAYIKIASSFTQDLEGWLLRYETPHNDIRHNATQHKGVIYDTQHNNALPLC